MRSRLALSLLLLLLPFTVVQAQWDGDNRLGLFFSDSEFTADNTMLETPAAPFDSYIVAINPQVWSISGYEVSIIIPDPAVFVLLVSGPSGWTNFGSNVNHLAGFGVPVPVVDNAAVLSTMRLLYGGSDEIHIDFGAATPHSIPEHEGPVMADGANPDNLVPCFTTIYGTPSGLVAILNPHVAVEASSLTKVKALFQ